MFILALILLCYCRKKEEPSVDIPDNNFLNALIQLGVDRNADGLINRDEASWVYNLDVSGKADALDHNRPE
jgi:hypothetical protein